MKIKAILILLFMYSKTLLPAAGNRIEELNWNQLFNQAVKEKALEQDVYLTEVQVAKVAHAYIAVLKNETFENKLNVLLRIDLKIVARSYLNKE